LGRIFLEIKTKRRKRMFIKDVKSRRVLTDDELENAQGLLNARGNLISPADRVLVVTALDIHFRVEEQNKLLQTIVDSLKYLCEKADNITVQKMSFSPEKTDKVQIPKEKVLTERAPLQSK
jgi:hypothetical protein